MAKRNNDEQPEAQNDETTIQTPAEAEATPEAAPAKQRKPDEVTADGRRLVEIKRKGERAAEGGVMGAVTGTLYVFVPGQPFLVDEQDAATLVANGAWDYAKP